MEVGAFAWLLAPLSWAWGVLWYVLLRPWAVAVLIAVVSTAYLVVRHQKSRSQVCTRNVNKLSCGANSSYYVHYVMNSVPQI